MARCKNCLVSGLETEMVVTATNLLAQYLKRAIVVWTGFVRRRELN